MQLNCQSYFCIVSKEAWDALTMLFLVNNAGFQNNPNKIGPYVPTPGTCYDLRHLIPLMYGAQMITCQCTTVPAVKTLLFLLITIMTNGGNL